MLIANNPAENLIFETLSHLMIKVNSIFHATDGRLIENYIVMEMHKLKQPIPTFAHCAIWRNLLQQNGSGVLWSTGVIPCNNLNRTCGQFLSTDY